MPQPEDYLDKKNKAPTSSRGFVLLHDSKVMSSKFLFAFSATAANTNSPLHPLCNSLQLLFYIFVANFLLPTEYIYAVCNLRLQHFLIFLLHFPLLRAGLWAAIYFMKYSILQDLYASPRNSVTIPYQKTLLPG